MIDHRHAPPLVALAPAPARAARLTIEDPLAAAALLRLRRPRRRDATWRAARLAPALALLLAGCRTPPAGAPAARDGAPAECNAAIVYVASSPKLFVAGGEQPFLLLDATVARRPDGAPSFGVGYMASVDPAEARAEEAPRRAAGTAAVLLDAFTPVLPPDVRAAAVTAIFGAPGSWGVGLQVELVREGVGWRGAGTPVAHPVLVPPLPARVDRRASSERAAVLAARRFLERSDGGDRDGAWELVSAVVKATTSRTAFEDGLRPAAGPTPPDGRRECFHEYAARAGDLGMGDVLEVCFASDGGVDTVQVRLDDDREWRVSHVSWIAGGERQDATAAASAQASHPPDRDRGSGRP